MDGGLSLEAVDRYKPVALDVPDSSAWLPTLRRYFGFTAFRPLQAEIIGAAMAGRDVFAVLPTGGGKSLCFQLPALMREGLTVVISPLIALMKDQVDGLVAAGVPATFLNSTVESPEARERWRGLHQGTYRLLYVAPERLLLPGFLEDLERWKVVQWVVDEAHCISEWGHDFRPEYRQLAMVRQRFPQVPWMALTATATARVREDIARQLKLANPATFVASFNRPNLTYRVESRSQPAAQVLDYLRAHPRDAGIVYVQSRAAAESLAGKLRQAGVAAAAYHAGMDAADRARNQEQFLRDEVRVVCATVAFGMGVHKPNVRFVIHHDLPKNIEGYYQETGRAGRDGLPGECLLLFSAADVVKHQHFLGEKTDEREKDLARQQLRQMVHYAESSECRRKVLLEYFGEPSEGNCGNCDNCVSPRDRYDGTVDAQKFLSCVYRIRERSGFSVGLNHVIDVLRGADTERIRRFQHDQLSTYGIGSALDKPTWALVGRELIRMGFLRQTEGEMSVLELTPEGREVLRSRGQIWLTRPRVRVVASSGGGRKSAGEVACDEDLFESLRQVRKRLADELGVPPYIIFGDVTLRQMARTYPQDEEALRRIHGVGDRKLVEYGPQFLEAIRAYCARNPQQIFA